MKGFTGTLMMPFLDTATPHLFFVNLPWIFYSKDTDLEVDGRSCSLLVAIEAAHRDEASARPRLQAGGAPTAPCRPPTRERRSPEMFIRGPWRAWAILVLILAVQVAQHRSTFAQSPGTPAPSTPTPTPTPAAPEAATPALELKGILDVTILDKGYFSHELIRDLGLFFILAHTLAFSFSCRLRGERRSGKSDSCCSHC